MLVKYALTQTPREISAPASAKALAIAQPKPCNHRRLIRKMSESRAAVRSTECVTCLIVCNTGDKSLLSCSETRSLELLLRTIVNRKSMFFVSLIIGNLPCRFIDSPDGAGLAPLPLSALVTARLRFAECSSPRGALAPATFWLMRWTLLK